MCAELPRLDSENAVTDLEFADRGADSLDIAGKLAAEDPPPRPADPGDESREERLGGAKRAVRAGHRGHADPDEDFVCLGYRPLDVFDSQDVRGAVAVVDHGPHGVRREPSLRIRIPA